MYQRHVRQRSSSIAIWTCLLALALSGSLLAQQQNDDIAPGVISGTSTFASPYSNGLWGEYFPRVSVQHRTEGAGYDYSLTDFRTWVPLYESYDSQSLTFFDGAFLLSNDRNVGMNAVVGQRFYFEELDRTFGGFVGYDNRDTGVQTVGQVVTGFESLGLIDFRVNGYFPTDTSPVSTGGGSGGFADPVYVGNIIQLTQLTQFEVAMKGFDAEVGGALPKIGDYVRAYLGFYNFQGEDSPQAWGWKTRFESHITDRMRLYLTVTDDQVFDTNVVFGAAFFFPGSSARRVPRYDSYVNKMDEPLVRNEAVVVNKISESSVANATNPVTMADQQVIHVDPNAAAAGDGTVENPYNTLAAAQAGSAANDIIFVHPRSDGTATNLTHGLTLKENQRLLGSTTQHQFTATQGTFNLPGYEAGNRPMLAAGGDVVTLADNNEVSGFRFNNPSSEAIFGNGINGYNINNNYFEHTGTNNQTSLYVLNATGTGVIRDNTFSSTTTLVGNSIRANLTGTANLTIDGNRITRVISTGGADAIYIDSTVGSDVTLNLTDNYISNFVNSSGHGIDLFLLGNVNANISGNEIYQGVVAGVTDYGLYVRYGQGTVTIDDNRIGSIATAALVDSGIRVSSFSTTTTNTYFTNNTVSDFLTATAFGSGIEFESIANPSTNNVVMTGNSISHSLAAGFTNGYSVVSNDGDVNLNFQNNTTSGSFGDFAADFVSNDDTFNMRMLNNTLSDDVQIRAAAFSHEFNFEVFGGQTLPGLLISADVTGQNTISGAVSIDQGGGGVDRAAPNSLPIPE